MNTNKLFVVAALLWLAAALAVAYLASRWVIVAIVPIAAALWFAANAERVRQSTQLVLPVLLLPGALMCFIGVMQALGYGQMVDEPMAAHRSLRVGFFGVGLALHFAAFWLLADESRASDHPSGERATKI